MICGWTDAGLAGLQFATAREAAGLAPLGGREGERGCAFLRELDGYFRTGRARFRTRVDLSAGSEFDRSVWRALLRIQAGRVRTYGEVAREVGRPGAARAVGGACGRNPVAIVVPCHRVVASNGLGGFGAGLDVKRRLLGLEGVSV
jgi:methylated-DNA-[protein]-cysteine S-methyltransferase